MGVAPLRNRPRSRYATMYLPRSRGHIWRHVRHCRLQVIQQRGIPRAMRKRTQRAAVRPHDARVLRAQYGVHRVGVVVWEGPPRHRIPLGKAQLHERQRDVIMCHRRCSSGMCSKPYSMCWQPLANMAQGMGNASGGCTSPRHARHHGEHIQVVRWQVGHHAARRACIVCLPGMHIGIDALLPPTNPQVGVRWHVQQVARASKTHG